MSITCTDLHQLYHIDRWRYDLMTLVSGLKRASNESVSLP